MRRIAIFFTFLIVSPFPAFAQERWTNDEGAQVPAPENENRIIRWCSLDGKHERFASANIDIQGYVPCGELHMPVSCDPQGARFIGKSDNLPYAYRNCSLGKRIVIDTPEPKPELVSQSELPLPLEEPEKKELASDLKNVERAQNADPQIQLQKMLDGMLSSLLSSSAGVKGNQRRGNAEGKLDRQGLDELLRYVDPSQQEQLKNLLGQP